MTDARFPAHWLLDQRFDDLSGDAFQLFAAAMMWSVSNRTEGVVPDRKLSRLPWGNPRCAPDLAAAGLWVKEGDNWLIIDFEKTQTSSAHLESAERTKRLDRERKSRERAAKAAAAEGADGVSVRTSGRKSRRTSGGISKESESASASESSEAVGPGGDWGKDRKPDDGTDWPTTPVIPGQSPPVDDPPSFAIFDRMKDSGRGSNAHTR